jgi:hypothetical protein
MAELDRPTARALVEAGYMPLRRYIEQFGKEIEEQYKHLASPSTVPEVEVHEPIPVKIRVHDQL